MLSNRIQYFEGLIHRNSLEASEGNISDAKNEKVKNIIKPSDKENDHHNHLHELEINTTSSFSNEDTSSFSNEDTSLISNEDTYLFSNEKATNRIIALIAEASVDKNLQVDPDDFGLNDFSRNCNDNYIIEATNEDGMELKFTFFGTISRYVAMDQGIEKVFDHLVCEFSEKLSNNKYSNLTELRFNNESTKNGVTRPKNKSDVNTENVDYEYVYINDKIVDTTDDQNESHPEQLNRNLSESSLTPYEDDDEVEYSEGIYMEVDGEENLQIDKPTAVDPPTSSEKISFIVEELIRTETTYLAQLLKLFEYQTYLATLTDETFHIFANVSAIYNHTRSFLASLQQKRTADNIADAFINHERGFLLYPEFAKNEVQAKIYLNKFEEPLKVKQKALGEPLDLAYWLRTPLQRLANYNLFLERLQKHLKKTNVASMKIDKALHIVKRELRKSNDLIVIDSIKYCPIDLTTQGSFLLKEKFKLNVKCLKSEELDAMVFLFEDIIVLTLNYSIPAKFPYLGHIEMKDLAFDSRQKGKFLQISNYVETKRGKGNRNTYVMEAKTKKIKKYWVEILHKLLRCQFLQAEGMQERSSQNQERGFSDAIYSYIRQSRPLVLEPKEEL